MAMVLADAGVIGGPVVHTGVGFPTDHAGVVSQLGIIPGVAKGTRR